MPVIPFIPAIIGAGASIGGALLSGRGKQRTTQASTWDPQTSAFRSFLMNFIQGKLKEPMTLDPALLSEGTSDINKAFNAAIPGMQSEFSARGLGTSGLFGGNLSNLATSRLGSIVQLVRQLTGTATDRQNTLLNLGASLVSPTGATGTTTGPGMTAGLGAGLSDLGTLFGIMAAMGKNIFKSNSSGSNPPLATLPIPSFANLMEAYGAPLG